MIVLVERHEYFVINLRNPQEAASRASSNADHSRPGIEIRKCRNMHLHPAFGKYVEVAGDDARRNSEASLFFLSSGEPFEQSRRHWICSFILDVDPQWIVCPSTRSNPPGPVGTGIPPNQTSLRTLKLVL